MRAPCNTKYSSLVLIVTELTDHAAFNGSVYDVGMRLDERTPEETREHQVI